MFYKFINICINYKLATFDIFIIFVSRTTILQYYIILYIVKDEYIVSLSSWYNMYNRVKYYIIKSVSMGEGSYGIRTFSEISLIFFIIIVFCYIFLRFSNLTVCLVTTQLLSKYVRIYEIKNSINFAICKSMDF